MSIGLSYGKAYRQVSTTRNKTKHRLRKPASKHIQTEITFCRFVTRSKKRRKKKSINLSSTVYAGSFIYKYDNKEGTSYTRCALLSKGWKACHVQKKEGAKRGPVGDYRVGVLGAVMASLCPNDKQDTDTGPLQ